MAILNYTTKIDPHKTVGEIQQVLAKGGAMGVSIEYADGEPAAVTFLVKIQEQYVNFRLPSNWHGVHVRLIKDPDVPPRLRTEAQARRVAWRIVKDWVEAQMALIQSGLAELPEVFLPYAIKQDGRTVYEEFRGNLLLLGEG